MPSGLIVRMGLCRDDKSTGLFQQQSRMNQARTNRYRGCRSQCPLKASSPRGVTRHAIASARHDQLRDVTGLSIRWEKVPWGMERSQAAVRTAAPRCRVKSVITDSFARFTARMSGGSQRVPTGIVACAPRHPRRLDAPGVPAEMSSIP